MALIHGSTQPNIIIKDPLCISLPYPIDRIVSKSHTRTAVSVAVPQCHTGVGDLVCWREIPRYKDMRWR